MWLNIFDKWNYRNGNKKKISNESTPTKKKKLQHLKEIVIITKLLNKFCVEESNDAIRCN